MRDVTAISDYFEHDDAAERHADDHDQVGTVEVQILLSWFFETNGPGEIAVDLPDAA